MWHQRKIKEQTSDSRDGGAEFSSAFLWREDAKRDAGLCRAFADLHGARLKRSTRCQRIAWGDGADFGYGVALPDLVPPKELADDDWYIYNVDMDLLIRCGRTARERANTIILPDGIEDWVELLRQAVRDVVFELSYEVAPMHIDAFGETEFEACGFEVTIRGHAPHALTLPSFELYGTGETPEQAARQCCDKFLRGRSGEQSLPNL